MLLESLITSTLNQHILLILFVIVIKLIIDFYQPKKPINFFTLYCVRLAEKVNKTSNSSYQQKIAGCIAVFITLSTIIVMLWTFEIFIEVPLIWHGFLLYFSLGNLKPFFLSKTLSEHLINEENEHAKKLLQHYLLRDCQSLSKLGLIKAYIEMRILTTSQQLIVPCLLFIVIDPLLALTFKLILTMHYQWNIKIPRYANFGRTAHFLVNILQWLPARIFALLVLFTNINQYFSFYWQLSAKYLLQQNSFLLSNFAMVLGIQLSGVAKYESTKLRKPLFNKLGRKADIIDMTKTDIVINKVLVLFSVILISILLLNL